MPKGCLLAILAIALIVCLAAIAVVVFKTTPAALDKMLAVGGFFGAIVITTMIDKLTKI